MLFSFSRYNSCEQLKKKPMSTATQLSENSHQGFDGIKAALCLASMEAKPNTALEMPACLWLEGIGSRSSGKERDAETGWITSGRGITTGRWDDGQARMRHSQINIRQIRKAGTSMDMYEIIHSGSLMTMAPAPKKKRKEPRLAPGALEKVRP
jgi:hypothetical protein